jgi:acetyl-CoA synthetase
VAKKIGPVARPGEILFAAEMPKTRSGKIMRRVLARSPIVAMWAT